MNLRLQIRQWLRMCGHALVRTVHERLDVLERQNIELRHQVASIAETQGALLQGSIHSVESLRQLQDELRLGRETARQWQRLVEGLRNQVASLTSSQGLLRRAVAALQAESGVTIDHEPPLTAPVETADYQLLNPETALMTFLFSAERSRKAVDIGAHVGKVSEALLNAGYEVYSFEPNPPVFEKLVDRLGGREGFHAFDFAIGASEGEMLLHVAKDLSAGRRYQDETTYSSLVPHTMPEDLPFVDKKMVRVRTLAELHRTEVIPVDIDLVKIDTEGFDLEVVRGMGEYRYPVVVAEFWDKQIPFGQEGLPYTLESMVGEMRLRGYPHHIVIYKVWGQDQAAYYCNLAHSVPNSYGNCFFFREFSVFTEARRWCSAVLPRTHFKPARAC